MESKPHRYHQNIAMASSSTLTLPLPTAYGHASSDIFILDSLSCFFTATGGTTASYGGLMKSFVTVNATSSTATVFSQIAPVVYYATAATSGVNYGGFIWESVNGLPLWAATTAAPSDPGQAGTAYYLRHQFTGSGYATGAPAVEVFVSFHFENPARRG